MAAAAGCIDCIPEDAQERGKLSRWQQADITIWTCDADVHDLTQMQHCTASSAELAAENFFHFIVLE